LQAISTIDDGVHLWCMRLVGWACSSAGEHYVDIVGVTGSIPVTPTILQAFETKSFYRLRVRRKNREIQLLVTHWSQRRFSHGDNPKTPRQISSSDQTSGLPLRLANVPQTRRRERVGSPDGNEGRPTGTRSVAEGTR